MKPHPAQPIYTDSIFKKAKVVRDIVRYLLERQPQGDYIRTEVLGTEGFFRISARKYSSGIDAILDMILNQYTGLAENEPACDPHDYSGAIKRVLLSDADNVPANLTKELSDDAREALKSLREAFADDSPQKTIPQKTEDLIDFIDHLAQSSQPFDNCLAQLLHDYFHLIHCLYHYTQNNARPSVTMDVNGMVVASVSPFISNLLTSTAQLESLSIIVGMVQPVCAAAIADQTFKYSFEELYPDAMRNILKNDASIDMIEIQMKLQKKSTSKNDKPVLERHFRRQSESLRRLSSCSLFTLPPRKLHKVLLLGEDGCGKTSLLLKATEGLFTDSASIAYLHPKEHAIEVDGNKVYLELSERQREDADKLLTDNVYTYVITLSAARVAAGKFLDIKNRMKGEIDSWISLLQQNPDLTSTNLAIVITACDLVPRSSVLMSIDEGVCEWIKEHTEMTGNVSCWLTSAKTGRNVDNLFRHIANSTTIKAELKACQP